MIDLVQQISTSVKLGWIVWLVWAVVQIAWYRRARLDVDQVELRPASTEGQFESGRVPVATVDEPVKDDNQNAPVETFEPANETPSNVDLWRPAVASDQLSEADVPAAESKMTANTGRRASPSTDRNSPPDDLGSLAPEI